LHAADFWWRGEAAFVGHRNGMSDHDVNRRPTLSTTIVGGMAIASETNWRRSDVVQAGFESGDFFRQLVDQTLQGHHRQSADARILREIDAKGLITLLQFARLGPRIEQFSFVVELVLTRLIRGSAFPG
jgi:hypothetical protein